MSQDLLVPSSEIYWLFCIQIMLSWYWQSYYVFFVNYYYFIIVSQCNRYIFIKIGSNLTW